MNNIINPAAIISEYKSVSSKSQKSVFTNRELLQRSFFQNTNKFKGIDGRTFDYIDENGEYVSSRVSPYSLFIEDNLEPKIKDVVLVLLKKGYLTTDSCQGHSDRKYRFVNVAFNTQQQLEKFKKFISINKFISFEEIDLREPQKNGYVVVYDQCGNNNQSIEKMKKNSSSYGDCVDYFNMMFLRDYDNYFLLKVKISDGESFSPIKRVIYYFFNDYYTKNFLKSLQNMPDYEDKI